MLIRKWMPLVIVAAVAAGVVATPAGRAEEKPAATSADPAPAADVGGLEGLVPDGAVGDEIPEQFQDAGFAKFVDLKALARALSDQDAGLALDVGLQLAEGERVLMRPHKVIKAATVLDVALRFAQAKGDKDTLARLGKAAVAYKMDDLAGRVTKVQALPPAVRATGPSVAIGTLTPDDVVNYAAYQKQILLARSIGDKEDLQALRNGLDDADLSPALKGQIAKDIDAALKETPDPKSPEDIEALRALAGAARDTNKGDVQNSVRNGWLAVAWGKEIDFFEYVKLVTAMATGTIGVYLADLARSSAATLGMSVVLQAVKNAGRTFGAGQFVCVAGIATYNHWKYIKVGGFKKKISGPNTHQPYIKWKRK